MAPYSSTLAWKIPWMEEPGRLQFMGLLRIRHDWATSLSHFTFHFHASEKEMATHSSVLPGESQGRGAWWAAFYGVTQSCTWLKRLSSSSNRRRRNIRKLKRRRASRWFLFKIEKNSISLSHKFSLVLLLSSSVFHWQRLAGRTGNMNRVPRFR